MSVSFVSSDDAPSVFGALTNADGTAFDLTNAASLRFQMRLLTAGAFTVDAAAVIVTSMGSVRYDWAPGDLDTAGEYESRWQITWSDGSIQHTSPSDAITVEAP